MSSMKDIILRTPEQLGAAIRLRRKEKGLTQNALAALLGAERKWVINLESGNSKAEIGLVLRAFEALNLRASLIDAGTPRSRGTLRDASRLDQVFQRLQQPSK
ncbi:MAG TPA: helix-turn-helix domain-containing protein [Steroidobacteraceae bacterium]|nr:helix-turn-helix domain-containing protein [Steroidobacteraceae bacterium]